MTQKAALILAAAATAFVLVAIGGVSATLAQRTTAPAAADQAAAPTGETLAPAGEATAPSDQATALAEAPATPLPEPIAGEVGPVAALPPAEPAPDDSAEDAALRAVRIATDCLGGGVVREIEIETVGDVPVYKVELQDGWEVAVDPASEQVVYAELDERSRSGVERERDGDRERDRDRDRDRERDGDRERDRDHDRGRDHEEDDDD